VGPASVGTANYWQGEPLGLGGSGKFSVNEGDGANSFSAAHKWRGDVLHNVSGNNVFEGHLETVPQHEGAVQQQQPWWNRGSESRGSGVWAYNSQQLTNNGPTSHSRMPALSRSNSRDTLNSMPSPNQGIFVQGAPQSMSTMIG